MVESKDVNFVSITETVEDCEAVIKWARKRRINGFKIIALSLESFRYLKRFDGIESIHIWDILDMEDIFHRAFFDSQKAVKEWASFFSKRDDNLYDVAFRGELDYYNFYHSFVCVRVAELLKEIFVKKEWAYVVPPLKLIFCNNYFPHWYNELPKNFLFKMISADIFLKQGIGIQHCSAFNRFKMRILPCILFTHIIFNVLRDIIDILKGWIFPSKTINRSVRFCQKPINIFTSGWGSNLSGTLSINKFKESIEKRRDISCFNLIWRPGKIKGFDMKESSGISFKNIIIRENIKNGAAYGPKLSMFSVFFLPKYFSQFFNIILPRLKKIFNERMGGESNLEKIFEHESVRINTAFHVFFAYKAGFLTAKLDEVIFKRLSPSLFVGSDSFATNTRIELLVAKKYNVLTFSTPHGYQAYSAPKYHFLADTILTHGEATRRLFTKIGISSERVIAIGNNKLASDKIREVPSIARVVVATRSRGGLWSNYSSLHDVYDEQIMGLAFLLAKEERFNTVIKSHPNGDYRQYYDLVVKDINSDRITHISQGWKLDKFNKSCDILVCVGEATGFFLSACCLKIPIVFITKTMTKTLKTLNYNYEDACVVVDDFSGAFKAIKKIASDDNYRLKLLEKQNEFIKGYTKDNPEESLTKLIETILKK